MIIDALTCHRSRHCWCSAVRASRGAYLCFLDSDDVMHPQRVALQLQAALAHPGAIVGSQFTRIPLGATERSACHCSGGR